MILLTGSKRTGVPRVLVLPFSSKKSGYTYLYCNFDVVINFCLNSSTRSRSLYSSVVDPSLSSRT